MGHLFKTLQGKTNNPTQPNPQNRLQSPTLSGSSFFGSGVPFWLFPNLSFSAHSHLFTPTATCLLSRLTPCGVLPTSNAGCPQPSVSSSNPQHIHPITALKHHLLFPPEDCPLPRGSRPACCIQTLASRCSSICSRRESWEEKPLADTQDCSHCCETGFCLQTPNKLLDLYLGRTWAQGWAVC